MKILVVLKMIIFVDIQHDTQLVLALYLYMCAFLLPLLFPYLKNVQLPVVIYGVW